MSFFVALIAVRPYIHKYSGGRQRPLLASVLACVSPSMPVWCVHVSGATFVTPVLVLHVSAFTFPGITLVTPVLHHVIGRDMLPHARFIVATYARGIASPLRHAGCHTNGLGVRLPGCSPLSNTNGGSLGFPCGRLRPLDLSRRLFQQMMSDVTAATGNPREPWKPTMWSFRGRAPGVDTQCEIMES